MNENKFDIGDSMDILSYGLLRDKQNTDEQEAENKNKGSNVLMATAPKSMFDFGGGLDVFTQRQKNLDALHTLQGDPTPHAAVVKGYSFGGNLGTNSSDFSTGLTHIDAGGSHEKNPNDGVQVGVDPEGTPNLVEEGETIWNDYVFSARINADAETKKKFHLPLKKDITYAEISKKLEKEIAERVNDPISEAGFKAQMQTLQEQQERQKQEMEAEKAKAAFEALSPEEQTALMQRAAQEEQMAQQAAQQPQANPEELAMAGQAPSPEEQAMLEQQQLAEMQANVSALGGELVKAGEVKGNKNIYAFAGTLNKRQNRKLASKYSEDWFKQQAKALGISDELMSQFKFNPNDAEGNLSAFNEIYRTSQYNKALDTYRTGQRQSKKNELFGDNGLYRYSADKKHLYRSRTNDADRIGYINKTYTGDTDDKGAITGFLSTEDYNKKRAAYDAEKDEKKKAELLNELEGYKAINEKAGDYMYDFYGKRLETPETMSEDEILKQYDTDYANGFKWDDKDAQTLQYSAEMEHSPLSYARYVPALGGLFGYMHDVFSSPDYSRAEGIQNSVITPRMVKPNYNPNYMTYRPMDIWHQQNALNAQARATDRALLNSNSPSRTAGLLASGYNSQLASGNLYRQALEYNDALEKQVLTHNSGENKTLAQLDMQAQLANQKTALEADWQNNRNRIYGYQMMDDIDSRRNASMNANLTNLFTSIGNIGEEAYDEDRIDWLRRTGVLKGAKGGPINRKKGKRRGLTI